MIDLDRYYESIETHRRLVWQVGRVLGVDTAQLTIHDLSKYDPVEFNAYAEWFHGDRDETNAKKNFQIAWQHHTRCNFYHWQHWILDNDTKGTIKNLDNVLSMPYKYIIEMVADWQASEIQYQSRQDMSKWLNSNFDKMVLHKETRDHVIQFLEGIGYEIYTDIFMPYKFILDGASFTVQKIEEIVIRHNRLNSLNNKTEALTANKLPTQPPK